MALTLAANHLAPGKTRSLLLINALQKLVGSQNSLLGSLQPKSQRLQLGPSSAVTSRGKASAENRS